MRISVAIGGILAVLGGCTAVPSVPAGSRPVPGEAAVSGLEAEIHERVNEYRRDQNDRPLGLDPILSRIARDHSQAMAAGTRAFGHDGFDARAAEARTALAIRQFAENVATNNFSAGSVAREAVDGWIGSPGHLRNLRGAFELTGVGVARSADGYYFITQLYGAR